MIKIDETNQVVRNYRTAQTKLSELNHGLAEKEKELDSAKEKYLLTLRPASLDAEANALLEGKSEANAVAAKDVEKLERELAVVKRACEIQKQAASSAAGKFSLVICESQRGRYAQIERRIVKAVEELAAANRAELDFFLELEDAGVSIRFRPMGLEKIGTLDDAGSGASLHRREVKEFLPEALA